MRYFDFGHLRDICSVLEIITSRGVVMFKTSNVQVAVCVAAMKLTFEDNNWKDKIDLNNVFLKSKLV